MDADRTGVLIALVRTESLRTLVLAVITSLDVVDIEAAVLDRATEPMPTELGILDAIHLSTAPLWKQMKRVDLVNGHTR